MPDNAITAIYVSIWSMGEIIRSQCRIDQNTKEVFDIEPAGYTPDDGACIEERVEIGNESYPVICEDDIDPKDFYDGYWRR